MEVKQETMMPVTEPVNQSEVGEVNKPVFVGNTIYTNRLKGNFGFFGVATLLYALLYGLCMFKNNSGVAYPFFVAGSLLYICLSLSKLEISLKKGALFQMICMMLLAVATFATDDGRIIFFNKLGIFLLAICLVLQQFYDTHKWGLGKFFAGILQSIGNMFGELPAPVRDAKEYFKTKKGKYNQKTVAAILGVVIMIPVLVVILSLLSSADVVFNEVTKEILEWLELENLGNIFFRTVICFFGAYALLTYFCGLHISPEVTDRRKGEPILMMIITAGLTVVYAYFSVIQIIYLFMGQLELPEGYTYAEYAREGFFQLLLVGIINLVIVLCTLAYFKESKVLKTILTLMSLCTFVMIASSAYRMVLNIRYYYLTFMRILVLWGLIILFFMFVGVIFYIWKESFPLFRYGVTIVSVLYIALAFSHPDYWIAKVNLSNAEGQVKGEFAQEFFLAENDYDDFYYIATLCADAAPVVYEFMDEVGYYDFAEQEKLWYTDLRDYTADWEFGHLYLKRMRNRTEDMNWRTYNISRHMAVLSLEKYEPSAMQE